MHYRDDLMLEAASASEAIEGKDRQPLQLKRIEIDLIRYKSVYVTAAFSYIS